MKKILWKSEYRLFTVLFGTITLFCLLMGVIHVAEGKPEEAFGSAVAGLIPLVLTLVFALTDSDALRRAAAVERDTPEARALWDESGLNPKNSDRAKAAMDQDPPPIG